MIIDCWDTRGAPVDGPRDTEIAVRDSKDPAGPSLSFTPSAWRSFMARSRRSS
jgi:Domain of unknown function (DUF397)